MVFNELIWRSIFMYIKLCNQCKVLSYLLQESSLLIKVSSESFQGVQKNERKLVVNKICYKANCKLLLFSEKRVTHQDFWIVKSSLKSILIRFCETFSEKSIYENFCRIFCLQICYYLQMFFKHKYKFWRDLWIHSEVCNLIQKLRFKQSAFWENKANGVKQKWSSLRKKRLR